MNSEREIDEILLKNANLPRRYQESALADCSTHQGWAEAFKKLCIILGSKYSSHLVVLCGARGTGKTRMATEIIRFSALHHRFFTRYEIFQDYLDCVGRNFNADDHDVRYLAPRLVVIDEIAKAGDSAWAESRLFHLVNTRYNDLKHSVLITSAQPDRLHDLLGPSVSDRLNEGGAVVHLDWPSFRSNQPPP